MKISVLKPVSLVSSVGVTESTAQFDPTHNRTFVDGELLASGNEVFERTGGDVTPTVYNAANDADYTLNQVLFKDSKLQFVASLTGAIVRKQPEAYLPPENLKFGKWANRYAKLGTLVNNKWTGDANGVTHSLRESGGKWYYSLSNATPQPSWSVPKYSKTAPESFIRTNTNTPPATAIAISPDAHGEFIFDDGTKKYKMETEKSVSGKIHWNAISEAFTTTGTQYETEVQMFTRASAGNTEEKARCYEVSNCENEWVPRTIIRRGDDIYIRTDTNDPAQEITGTATVIEPLVGLRQAGGWGWTYIRPSNQYAPFDNKHYTQVHENHIVEYTVSGVEFDTVALSHLIASKVEFTFTPTGGTALPMVTLTPQNHIDKNGRLPSQPTTSIAYIPSPISGTVHIKIYPRGNQVILGSIDLGIVDDAGFTNLVFTNKFKDYSPFEKDQWGNITRVPGVKTNIYSGTVDILISDYDRMNRFLKYIAGTTVILNGSDTTDNKATDEYYDVFAATMVVGYVGDFVLRTKLDRTLLSQMASYSFTIEELV